MVNKLLLKAFPKDTDYITEADFKILNDACEGVISILVKIVLTTKRSLGRMEN